MAEPNDATGTIDKECSDSRAGEWKSVDDKPVTARCTLTNSGNPCSITASFINAQGKKIGKEMVVAPGNTNSEGHSGVIRIEFDCSKGNDPGGTCKGSWTITV